MFLFWVIGLPVIGFTLIYRNKENLNSEDILAKYRMLYQGLRPEAYYWEFLNVMRKIMLIAINVFLSGFDIGYKPLCALIVLVIALRIQERVNPYKKEVFNALEYREIAVSVVTI